MTPSKPPIVRPTRVLPFDQLPWDDFERLCLMLLPREGFENPQHYGAAGGERGRDIVAHRDGDLWYVQCKQVKRCGPKVLLDEIDKVQRLMEDDPDLRPAGMLFIVSCDVSATARDRTTKRCKELGLVCEVWGRTDLDAHIQPHSDIVRTFFGWYTRPPLGVPFQAPPLPAHFVPRPEVSDALKARMLAEGITAPGALVVSAVHGLGGIGKTTLVADLARDSVVQGRFADGILWATLGQQPDVLSFLASWIQALGDYDFHPTRAESASAHLRTLLHSKACLLVVDDAWQADHARSFLVGGERCRVLVTTRDATLARKVGAHLYDLDVMTEPQALALFEARLGPLDGHREQAAALALELDYLPLALELAAAQIDTGCSWAGLLDTFRQGLADLAALDLDGATFRNESLRLSFRLSLERLLAEDQEAFAWLGALPEDVRLNSAMAATLWDQPEADAHNRLRCLRDKALLKPAGGNQYMLHDLLHDEAKLRLTERVSPEEAHAVLLDRYRQKVPNERWDRLPDDGYIHEHLTWHMEQSGQTDAIHTLLCLETPAGRNAWYEARDKLGHTGGYLQDVRRAGHQAEEAKDVGLQIRYAVLHSSVISISANVPPVLLVWAMESSFLPPTQILTLVRNKPDDRDRAQALSALAPVLESQWPTLFEQALAIATTIEESRYRTSALLEMAPHMPENLLREAVRVAKDIEDEAERLNTLVGLSPHLDDGLLTDVLTAVQGIERPDRSSKARALLAPHLPQSQQSRMFEQAMEAAHLVPERNPRARLLIELLPHLPPLLRNEAFREALPLVMEITNANERAERLTSMVSHLPPSLQEQVLKEALEAIHGIEKTERRVEALDKLISYLPDELREQAAKEILPSARTIGDVRKRIDTLIVLMPHLPNGLQAGVVRDALTDVEKIAEESARARALTRLAPYLPEELLYNAIGTANSVNGGLHCVEAWVGIAPYLPEPLREYALRRALLAVYSVSEQSLLVNRRAMALRKLVPHLPETMLRQALRIAQSIRWIPARAETLSLLMPHLPAPMQEEALRDGLKAARRIGHGPARARALLDLTTHLPESSRESIMQEALVASMEIEDIRTRTQTLAALVSYLPRALRKRAGHDVLVAGRSILWPQARAGALAYLIPYLPVRLRRQVLKEIVAAICEVGLHQMSIEAIDFFARHLPRRRRDRIVKESWDAAHELDGSLRVRALSGLAPHLPESNRRSGLREALAAVKEEGAHPYRSIDTEALTTLAPHLPDELLADAWTMVWRPLLHARALSSLASRLPAEQVDEALDRLRERCYPEMSDDEWRTAAQTELVKSLFDEALVGLAPHLPKASKPQALEKALAAAREMGPWNRTTRVEALTALLPYLPEALREAVTGEVLALAREMPQDGHAPSPLIEGKRAGVLSGLVPHLVALPRDALTAYWCETLPVLASETRQDLILDIRALAPVIHKLGGEEAIAEAYRAIQDVGRWWP